MDTQAQEKKENSHSLYFFVLVGPFSRLDIGHTGEGRSFLFSLVIRCYYILENPVLVHSDSIGLGFVYVQPIYVFCLEYLVHLHLR